MFVTATPLIRIIDPDKHCRDLLHLRLTQHDWFVKTYSDVESLMRLDDGNRPGIVIVDLDEPTMGALEFLSRQKNDSPHPTIVMGEGATIEVAVEAMKLGAIDFFKKPVDEARLINVIHERLDLMMKEAELQNFVRAYHALSKREREVIELSIEGLTHEVVAERLGISIKTAQVHRYNAYRKLKLHNVTEIFLMMTKAGLVAGSTD